MVTIFIAHAVGTPRVLQACVSSILRHDAGCDYQIHLYGTQEAIAEAAAVCPEHRNIEFCEVHEAADFDNSRQHMALLDEAMKREQGLVLTLDNDCFPVADGWLAELVQWHEEGYVLPGILWPWEPPAPEVRQKNIEWAIRSYQNWNNTWVACQLVHTDFIHDFSLTYGGDGNDTGFKLIDKVTELGLPMKGWMPSRCARPEWASAFDPEFNRQLCVFYGDKVFHVGGAARKTIGINLDPRELWGEAVELTLRKRGAEWLMNDEKSHRFRFDREAEVTDFKMRLMNAGIREWLKTHDSCLNMRNSK